MADAINGLTPDTKERVLALIEAARQQGWAIRVVSGRRTCAQQNALYAQSRTTPGPHVTDARGCQSWHVLGRAVDVAFVGMPARWHELGQLGKSLGFKWGGDFPGFPDLDHFEYHPGMTIESVCPNPEECVDMVSTGVWMDPGCGSGPRVRWLEDGSIELEGEGVKSSPLPSPVKQWSDLLHKYGDMYGVPYQFGAGIMGIEAGWTSGGRSPAGACGWMQLMPATASTQAGRPVSCQELLDNPDLNIQLGMKLLGKLLTRYGGNPIKSAFSYNAGGVYCGPGCLKREAGKCVETCPPNRFNIKADCWKIGANQWQTADYASNVIHFSNDALKSLPPPSSSGPGQASGGSGGSFVPLFGVALFGAVLGVMTAIGGK